MSTYTEKHRQYYLANRDRILSLRKEREIAWMATPKGKYSVQKRKARQRGIKWKLTFDEWLEIWIHSGKWEERGIGADGYCMCRYEDTGPYSVENVYIATVVDNARLNYQLCGTNPDGTYRSKLRLPGL